MQYFWWMARSDVTSLTMTREDLKQFLDSDEDIDDVFGAPPPCSLPMLVQACRQRERAQVL